MIVSVVKIDDTCRTVRSTEVESMKLRLPIKAANFAIFTCEIL